VRLTAIALSFAALFAGAQAPKLDDVVARLGRYVADYGERLANVVAEETYRQEIPQTIGNAASRTLRSDYALTRAADRDAWVGYRDTFEVDGRPVRDREERLQRLLGTGAFGQAGRIAEQNSRFNLANDLLPRNVNVPTFALDLLHPRNRGRFAVRRLGTDADNGRPGWLLEFRERERPTIVRTPDGRNQPSRIQVLVDPATGEILRTAVSWEQVKGSIVVTYGRVPGFDVAVPLRMSERFTTRNGSNINGDATYMNFRQFQTSGRVLDP
jgi:hypothetical protein